MRKVPVAVVCIALTLCFKLTVLSCWGTLDDPAAISETQDGYTGSLSCRKCHEKFYQLWAPSHHGLAMQPFSADVAKRVTPQNQEIVIGDHRYRAEMNGSNGYVVELGNQGEKRYPIHHVMGGKNVYYFLTTVDRGRLQTLPVAYDVNRKEWFDTVASGIRHFPGHSDESIHWKDWQYTFNTACYGCHVSQVSTNYDSKRDTYDTKWKEPGINCETCHGPALDHIKVCEAAPKGTIPKDLKIKRGGRDFTADQNNTTCSSCHAKAVVLTDKFQPGDKFFDHYGLVTLESPDYYPDGRDLGENYTYTSWLMSPCVKAGKLDCLHCHTSSGRYKFTEEKKANQACFPCHADKVDNPTKHTHHKPTSPGNKCISCHMPKTEFARMHRSDHSMLPPTPAVTIAVNSPNACNLCHKEKSAQWADDHVRKWRKRDYQAEIILRAGLIEAARKKDWSRIPEMLDYIVGRNRDEVFAASLIQLVRGSGDPNIVPALVKAAKDPSALVRAAAVTALDGVATQEAATTLIKAVDDNIRLVRVRAAASLAGFGSMQWSHQEKQSLEAANKEYMDSILTRPDQWDSHYNLGNYYMNKGDFKSAITAYDKALKIEPRSILAMVNQAMAYARMGDNRKAHATLENALKMAPANSGANFNMGLLKAEQNDQVAAEKYLRAALQADPRMAQAAYNLSIILAKDRITEAVELCQKAVLAQPNLPRYAFALAFFQQQKGDLEESAETLNRLISRFPAYADAYILLGTNYETRGKNFLAQSVYAKGIGEKGISDQYKNRMKLRLDALNSQTSGK